MSSATTDFDLQPDPRILPMLGEINLAQWKCLAELVDNSADAFLDLARAGTPVLHPEIHLQVPTSDSANAKVTVAFAKRPGACSASAKCFWQGVKMNRLPYHKSPTVPSPDQAPFREYDALIDGRWHHIVATSKVRARVAAEKILPGRQPSLLLDRDDMEHHAPLPIYHPVED